MTEKQQKLLSMMEWFNNFCKEHDIKYYAIGGTALGAVRHQGFIPWDDDMDIGLPRKEYDRVVEISRNLPEDSQYKFEFPIVDDDYSYPFGKLYDTHTTFIEKVYNSIARGIFIDIFPLDGAGNNEKQGVKLTKKIQTKNLLLALRYKTGPKKRKLWKTVVLFFLNHIPERILNKKRLFRQIDKLSRKYDYDKSLYVSNFNGRYGEKEIMLKEWFGEPKLLKFEDIEIYVPEQTDFYLKRLYNDYMKLPPEDERMIHEGSYENLNESYLKK